MSVTLATWKAIYDLSEPEFHRIQEGDPDGFEGLLEALTATEVADLLDWLHEPDHRPASLTWVRH
jgi:hypothetical protein